MKSSMLYDFSHRHPIRQFTSQYTRFVVRRSWTINAIFILYIIWKICLSTCAGSSIRVLFLFVCVLPWVQCACVHGHRRMIEMVYYDDVQERTPSGDMNGTTAKSKIAGNNNKKIYFQTKEYKKEWTNKKKKATNLVRRRIGAHCI